QTNLDDSALARVIYTINIDQDDPPRPDAAMIEAMLQEAGRDWSERLADALLETGAEESTIPEIVHRYGQAFPVAYRQAYTPKQAVYDLHKADEALADGRLSLDLYRDKQCADNQLRLKIYQTGEPVILSDILPVLEKMGLRVLSELPFDIRPQGTDRAV